MDKRLGLTVLINSSYLLTKQDKENLLEELKGMPESIVNTLGVLLATEKKQSLESSKSLDSSIKQVLLTLANPPASTF